jgi:hypothetical protein
MGLVKALALFLRAFIVSRAALAAENLVLRQQLSVLEHAVKRPKLHPRDRRFWVWLSRLWPNWRSVLRIVQPDTVLKWHKMGFKLYWRWKSKARKAGRPPIDKDIRDLIRRMARQNPLWGAPHILSELRLLGSVSVQLIGIGNPLVFTGCMEGDQLNRYTTRLRHVHSATRSNYDARDPPTDCNGTRPNNVPNWKLHK